MPSFSVSLTKKGWSIRDLDTGKTLTGIREELPEHVFSELKNLLGENSYKHLCYSTTIKMPWDNALTRWVKSMHQSVLTNGT